MQSTTYYELSQYEANDKPTWLVGYNGDMAKIDAGIHGAKAAADDAQTTATSADGKADTNADAISDLNTAVGNLENAVGGAQGNINTLNALMGNGTPTTSDQTVIGAINALEATIATSEDGASFANAYSVGDQFMRGGTLYTALVSISSGTAWSSLVLNTDYKVSDSIAEQINNIYPNIGNYQLINQRSITVTPDGVKNVGNVSKELADAFIAYVTTLNHDYVFKIDEIILNNISLSITDQRFFNYNFYPSGAIGSDITLRSGDTIVYAGAALQSATSNHLKRIVLSDPISVTDLISEIATGVYEFKLSIYNKIR